MSFLKQTRVVFFKELRDALRDRRSLMSALIFPLVGPLMIAFMFSSLAQLEGGDRALEVPIEGSERAPNLIAFLEERGLEVLDAPEDAEEAVRSGDHDLVLSIDDTYGEDFTTAQPATVVLIHDGSKTASRNSIRRTRNLLNEYNRSVSSLRLMARGISPEVVRALDVDVLDLATPAQLSARFFSMIPMFLIIGAFIAGLNVAIDTTAGERERQSLEPLLVNPVNRLALTSGKWLATSVFSLAGIAFTLPAFLFAMRFVPLEKLDVELSLGGSQIVWILVLLLPLALLASSAQMLVATFARSFKEAQTYVSLLTFAPMLPGVISSVRPLDTETWMAGVPALAQQQLLMGVIGGEAQQTTLIVLACAATTAAAVGCVFVTSQLLRSERIVFGR
ncbi:MAG: ABC transporter permease [Acidobacteriota bacterium]